MYGLGTVKSIEEKTVLGETISLAQIFFPRENMKMMVNIHKETELFRPLIEEQQVDAIFEHMKNHEGRFPSRANQRQRMNLDKIKSNDIFQLGEVIKDLHVMSLKKKLSFKESEMLERARQVMIEELTLVTGRKSETLDESIARACLSSN
jgi:CarD family transcriptional regulator, regulator of rRNA transcription